MPSFLKLTYLDASGEQSHVRFQGASLSAANFDAQVALQDALELAIADLVLGTKHKRTREASSAILSSTLPGVAAQREVKWLVVYHDNVTGKKYRLEIPTADTSLLVAGSDRIPSTAAEYIAFKDALEDYVLQGETPDNAVVLDYIQLVGRNL
jgi:hypothetical protein